MHSPRNSTSPLGQKHPANNDKLCIILPSPQVQVHESVRFEKVPGLHSLVQVGLRFSHVGGHAVPHWLYSIRRGHCLDDT